MANCDCKVKRVKKTKSGKLKRSKAYTSHILTKMSPKRKRKLRQGTNVSAADMKRVRTLVPYL